MTHGSRRLSYLDSHLQVEVVQYDPGCCCTEEPAHQRYEERGTVVISYVYVGHQLYYHHEDELDALRSILSDLKPRGLGTGVS